LTVAHCVASVGRWSGVDIRDADTPPARREQGHDQQQQENKYFHLSYTAIRKPKKTAALRKVETGLADTSAT
jgi:hypothetical protein